MPGIIFIPAAPVTDAEKLEKTKSLILSGINSNLSSLAGEVDYLFNLVWRNPYGLTPQAVLTEFGVNAAHLFQFMGAIQGALNVLQPGVCPQVPPGPFTVNSDGTVTLTVTS